jgi:glucoamylase
LLRAHEDKSYPGAFIASLSIPWGEAKGDSDHGGYHLVWTRDMVNSASAMLAAGDTVTPLRALIYLAVAQLEDGGFPQNFWVDGGAYWRGIQLDEVAFPILLAWQIKRQNALQDFDPYPMIAHAAAYLVLHGPVTQQERWEEVSGYSPSTLASNIAALICAACLFRERRDEATAAFLEEYADFLNSHVESWTVTTQGSLVPGISRHYIRILPESIDNPQPEEDPNRGVLNITNRPPAVQNKFPARDIIDAGFLELVRYGIRKPDDTLIVDSLRVVDAVLKVETPFGPCWRRYNNDGYGQKDDGGPFAGWGKGRGWPLLAGERGHFELAAGRDAKSFIRAMEGFSSATGLLPEQVWDEPDRTDVYMFLGRPTGSAMPLMWAHAEYIKLLRSVADGRTFDLIPEVAERYLSGQNPPHRIEVWKHNRQVSSLRPNSTLRVQAASPFRLHWTTDEWHTINDTSSAGTALGIDFVDVPIPVEQRAPVRFTFFWTNNSSWEGHDYAVKVES